MAATALTLKQAARTGVRFDNGYVACDSANGNSVANDGAVQLLFVNGTGAQTVVVQTPYTEDGGNLAAPSLTINLAASQSFLTNFFPPSVYGGTLIFTASAATVTVQPVHVSG